MRAARQEKIETRTARPFPSVVVPASLPTSKGAGTILDLNSDPLTASNSGPSTTPTPVQTPGITSSSTITSTSPGGDRVRKGSTPSHAPSQPSLASMNAADLDQIVNMVAARIDSSGTSRGPNSNMSPSNSNPDSQSLTSPRNASPSTPSHTTTSPSAPDANVSLDTILTLLAARVDPSYGAHNDVRDSRDLPPGYQVPPGYTG